MRDDEFSSQEARIESLENHVDALATLIKRQRDRLDELEHDTPGGGR